MSTAVLDKEAFQRRLRRIYKCWWKKGDEDIDFKGIDCLMVAVGVDENVVYSKSTALQTWLLGYEFTDMVMVFCKKIVYFLSSKKKTEILKQIESVKDDDLPEIKLLVRDKLNNSANYDVIIKGMKGSENGCKTIGVFTKDVYTGDFIVSWQDTLKKEGFERVDMSSTFALVMAPKEEAEINLIKKACLASVNVFEKYLRDQLMDIIDADKKIKHSKLAENVESAINDKKYVSGVDVNQIEMCYPAIIQSGGNYNLKFSVASDKNFIHFGSIICSLGARYKFYCSNIARTLLVNPSAEIQNMYTILVNLEEEILKNLVDGRKLSSIYESGVEYLKKEKPDLVDNLTKTFGFAMGIEFKEASLLIGPKTSAKARKNMVFNINIGFSNLVNKDAKDKESKIVALFIGDTVVVNADQAPTVLTTTKKKVKNISLILKDDEDDDEEDVENEKENLSKNEILNRAKRTAVIDSKLRSENSNEEKRKQHQKELAQLLNEKAKERLAKQSSGKDVEKVILKKDEKSNKVRRNTVSYKNWNQAPQETEVKDLKLYVDRKYETVILPIFGLPVAFHISTIKNISQSIEGDYTYLRINFHNPGTTMARNEIVPCYQSDATFAKEVTYRSTNSKEHGQLVPPSTNLNTAFRLIKEVQKRFKTREAEEKEKENLVKQDTLILTQNKGNPKLKDLYIRPNIASKRMTGSLEAHTNGFRYISVRGDKVDILYNNIRSAFFQPCDSEMIILLHFHLKHAIMFGKKKHIDVQFYTEVGEITTDLGKHQHMHDRDDIAAEQSERELRHKLKTAFKSFCEKVEALTKNEIEFDTPFRDLGYPGAPYRSTVLLQPTSTCLVNLTEWPPFVIILEDVELVHFERVQFHLKNFDMVFIFKDYSRKVSMVNAIPMNMLDHVKAWLDSCDIRCSEGIQSLNWAKIMKTITDDPEGFFDNGGWSFLDPDSDEEEVKVTELDDEVDDDAYEPSDSESSNESDDDSEYSEGDTESTDFDSKEEESLGSDEESGKDWSDLEKEAEREDNERGHRFSDDYGNSKNRSHHKKTSSLSHNNHKKSSRHDSSGGSSKSRHGSSNHHKSNSRSSNHHSSDRHKDRHRKSSSSNDKKRHRSYSSEDKHNHKKAKKY